MTMQVYWLGPIAGGALGALLYVLWFGDGGQRQSLRELFSGTGAKGALTPSTV